MAEPAISFQGVTRRYPQKDGATRDGGDFLALQDVWLDVPQGAVTGVIGRSGAGKSTLLRMVNGLERPSAGKVIVNDRDVGAASDAQLRAIRREVGMIFQHFNLLASRTVAENIALPLEIAGESADRIAPRVNELIARVGLSAQARRYPAELSGGQKQRVGIARALATGPRVLLSDEATSALDTESEKLVQSALDTLMVGRTSFVIAHRLSTIFNADQIFVIDNGQVKEHGTHEELLQRQGLYSHLYNIQFGKKNV